MTQLALPNLDDSPPPLQTYMEEKQCRHLRKVVRATKYRYARPGNKGDLLEISVQQCKGCGAEFESTCVLPPEYGQRY